MVWLAQKPLFPSGTLDAEAKRAWRQKLKARPAAFAAVQKVQPSTAPAWDGGVLQHHAVVLRLFFSARAEGGFKCMPGGLVRSARDPAFVHYGIRHGGTSKDVDLTDDAEKFAPTPVIPVHRHTTARSSHDLPSCVSMICFGLVVPWRASTT